MVFLISSRSLAHSEESFCWGQGSLLVVVVVVGEGEDVQVVVAGGEEGVCVVWVVVGTGEGGGAVVDWTGGEDAAGGDCVG